MPNDPIRAALQAAAQEVGAQVRSPDSTRGDVARTAIIAFLRALPPNIRIQFQRPLCQHEIDALGPFKALPKHFGLRPSMASWRRSVS